MIFALLLAGAAPAGAETVVVTADRMIDVLDGRVVEQPVITIVNGRISKVEVGAARPAPEGARRVDPPARPSFPA